MERINAQVPDGYIERAKKAAAKDHRPVANWVGKLVMDAVHASETSFIKIDPKQ